MAPIPTQSLHELLQGPPVTRFAPSPTGFLHLGHVASALFVWGIARVFKGSVVLRIEDHDTGRCRREFEDALFADLHWLGFQADSAPIDATDRPHPLRQSDSTAYYEMALDDLRQQGLVYACDCSRRKIAASATEHPSPELLYNGRCRDRGLPFAENVGLRVRMPDRLEAFVDGYLGHQEQNPAQQCGDMLIRDRHGQWTYQFAVVIDDLRQGINLIIRGQDLTASTGRQIALRRLLGVHQAPTFFHHPLITDASGIKLSKRTFSEAISKRRAAGEKAADLLGEAAYLVGLKAQNAPFDLSELPSLFKG